MYLFLLGVLPWIVSIGALIAGFLQWQNPAFFPWAWLLVIAIYAAAAWVIGGKRLPIVERLERLATPIGGLWLLSESTEGFVLLTCFFSGLLWVSLQLLYLVNHQPSRYPVNGLSRFHIACVPVAGFAMGVLGLGLRVFVGVPVVWLAFVFACIGGVLYVATSHPVATDEQRRLWGVAGAGFGVLLALLVAYLPTSASVAGAFCALLLTMPVRARRYLYQPYPTRRVTLIELAIFVLLFLLLIVGARWT
jgi:hypothetical protein